MTDKQPEALRLAASLELCWGDSRIDAAASELRRQHAENESLLTERERNLDSIRVNNEIINKKNAELETLRASHGQAPARATLPEGWVPLLIIHEGQYPEEIAYGPRRMMDRLDKWLRKYFDSVVAAAPTATAQAAPAAVAGPSGYGPKVTVKRRCSDCKACNSESYAVQGDSGHYVYCEHPSLPERKYIGDTHWDTPDWCPAAAPTAQPAPVVQLTSEQRLAMVVEMDAHDIVLAAIDAEAAAAQPAPQQEAQQQEVQEPVAWQSRTRQTWGGDTTPWSPWELCTKGQAEDYWKMPLLHDWAYEARALYTAPQPVEREPLSNKELVSLAKVGAIATNESGQVVLWPALYRNQMVDRFEHGWREAEKYHGIKGGQHGVDT